jgi:XTP/dITP diphosphohydrolase
MSPSHALTLVAATRSPHKLDEIRRILGKDPGLRILSLDEAGIPYSPEEDRIEIFDTFEENAKAKAAYFNSLCGAATIADDSGLEVVVLDGAPGVRSKRFAPAPHLTGEERDQANNQHLVQLLASHKPQRRRARFVCVAVLHFGLGEPMVFRGEAPGTIVLEPRGEGGFGYDPHFEGAETGKTFAELEPEEKDARSHRGNAFRALGAQLRETLHY